MQIEGINYFSNLPNELLQLVFFKNLDRESILCLSALDKTIHEYVFSELLIDLKIPFVSGLSVYSQVITHYKVHCEYFYQKLPGSFPDINSYATVTETKTYVDSILSMPCDPSPKHKGSILQKMWHCFWETVPRKWEPCDGSISWHYCVREPRPTRGPEAMIIMTPVKDYQVVNGAFDKEIQIFLAAGIRYSPEHDLIKFDEFDFINRAIGEAGCTKETVQMLIECKHKVTTYAVKAAAKNRCDEFFPDLLKHIPHNCMGSLFMHLPTEYRYILDDYIDILPKCSSEQMTTALEKEYPETIVLKILEKCNMFKRQHPLEAALKSSYSEDIILKILKKTDFPYFHQFVFSAIQRKHSENIVENILDRCAKVNIFEIELAEKAGYSEHLLQKMHNICSDDERYDFENFNRRGSCHKPECIIS